MIYGILLIFKVSIRHGASEKLRGSVVLYTFGAFMVRIGFGAVSTHSDFQEGGLWACRCWVGGS